MTGLLGIGLFTVWAGDFAPGANVLALDIMQRNRSIVKISGSSCTMGAAQLGHADESPTSKTREGSDIWLGVDDLHSWPRAPALYPRSGQTYLVAGIGMDQRHDGMYYRHSKVFFQLAVHRSFGTEMLEGPARLVATVATTCLIEGRYDDELVLAALVDAPKSIRRLRVGILLESNIRAKQSTGADLIRTRELMLIPRRCVRRRSTCEDYLEWLKAW